MQQRDFSLSSTEQAIASQLKKLQELYNKPPFELTKEDRDILEVLHNSANITCYKSASHTVKIEDQVHTCILEILQGMNIKENKIKLERLKAKDRQNMPYKATHMAGISAATMGFSLLIAAAVVVGLMSLPAGLVFFLPLLIIGIVSLASGAGSIKKGIFDNDKLFAEAWGHGGRVDEFISKITPEAEKVLIAANTYLQTKKKADNVNHPKRNYPSPLVIRNPRLDYIKSEEGSRSRDQSPLRSPLDSPPVSQVPFGSQSQNPTSGQSTKKQNRPRTNSLPQLQNPTRRVGVRSRTSSLLRLQDQTPPNSPQVRPESSQSQNPTAPSK